MIVKLIECVPAAPLAPSATYDCGPHQHAVVQRLSCLLEKNVISFKECRLTAPSRTELDKQTGKKAKSCAAFNPTTVSQPLENFTGLQQKALCVRFAAIITTYFRTFPKPWHYRMAM